MPYIDKAHREILERYIVQISHYVRLQPDDKRDGMLNYVVSELVGRTMKPKGTGWNYHWIHRAYGVFLAAGAEFYRRVAAPYETAAMFKNGDIEAYKHMTPNAEFEAKLQEVKDTVINPEQFT